MGCFGVHVTSDKEAATAKVTEAFGIPAEAVPSFPTP